MRRLKIGEEVKQKIGEGVRQAHSQRQERKTEQCVRRRRMQADAQQHELRWSEVEEADGPQQKSRLQDR